MASAVVVNEKRGMNKREVVLARGHADTFDRVRKGNKTYDAWSYGDGASLCYFEDDILFHHVER